MKKSKTQERLEAIMTVQGKKNLAEIWAEDELTAERVQEMNKVYEANKG